MSDVEDPPADFDGHVDIEAFWHSVAAEIVCRVFLRSKPRLFDAFHCLFICLFLLFEYGHVLTVIAGNSNNPCRVSPSYTNWAPWIGPRTKASETALNTEYAKIKPTKCAENQADIDVAEERLSEELMNLKVSLFTFHDVLYLQLQKM